MTVFRRFPVLSLALLSTVSLSAQSGDETLTAREIFYASVDAPAKPAKAKPSVTHRSRPVSPSSAGPAASSSEDTRDTAGSALPNGVRLIKAADMEPSPLGLRYSILKVTKEGNTEIDRDSILHAKDSVKLSVESSNDAFLYILNRGSSGTWRILFPSDEIHGGDNHIRKGMKYELPSGYAFTFDEQAGDEKLFIVLSRRAELDLDKLVYAVSPTGPASAPEPAKESSGPKMLMASAAVSDSTVANLEAVYSRDLIIEKVNDSAAPAQSIAKPREKAVYTVNTVGGPDARVVAEFTLQHR